MIRDEERVVNSNSYIDTNKFSSALRRKGIDKTHRRILITNFKGTEQSKDLTLPPNCGGFGRIHHFRRWSGGKDWPPDPLPIDPATAALGLPRTDELQVQIFQNAICSWRCWYCFVDYELLSGNPRYSEFKTVDELIDLYLAEPTRPKIIDLSGGQPDLVPEWGVWFMDAIKDRGLEKELYLWSDDNLSNDYLWRYLNREEIRRLSSSPNYGRVGCFKGFDQNSFSFNTKAAPEMFDMQFVLMRRLVEAGFDVYGYTTMTSNSDNLLSARMKDFVDRLQSEVHPLFPLRTIPLRIYEFSPTISRVQKEHQQALEIQKAAVQIWREELEKRFSIEERSRPIFLNTISGQ